MFEPENIKGSSELPPRKKFFWSTFLKIFEKPKYPPKII